MYEQRQSITANRMQAMAICKLAGFAVAGDGRWAVVEAPRMLLMLFGL